MLSQLACNATNSAAINKEGGVFVWGRGGFGLLADGKNSDQIKFNPQTVKLEYRRCQYKASQISMGPYHVAVVVNNSLSTKPFQELSYGQHFLKEIKKRIEGLGMTIDKWIDDQFENKQTVKEADFQKVMRNLFNTGADKAEKFVQSFLSDLNDPSSGDINLIQFIDQLKGARTHNGKVFTWGLSSLNRLGHGSTMRRGLFAASRGEESFVETMRTIMNKIQVAPPGVVEFEDNVAIKMVACGNAHTLALSTDGSIYSWGSGESGCLGHGQEIKKCERPRLIRSSNNNIRLNNVVQIAVGGFHSMLLTDEGVIYSWGEAENGRLGTGSLTNENLPRAITYFRRALKQTVIAIASGEAHSAAISSEEELFTWGAGSYGRLGHGDELDKAEPQMIEELRQRKISLVACGNFHTMCKSLNGEIYSWGSGLNEKLGHCSGSQKNKKTPFIITGLRKQNIVELCAGPFHNLAINDQNYLYVWGDSFNGKLGMNVIGDVANPMISNGAIPFSTNQSGMGAIEGKKKQVYSTPVAEYIQPAMTLALPPNLPLQRLTQVLAGYRNTYFLTNDGQLFGCGDNRFGQLAQPIKVKVGKQNEEQEKKEVIRDFGEDDDLPRGMLREAEEPVVIPAFSGNIRQVAQSVACGYHHVICITDAGRPLSWGRCLEGQLGIGKVERYVNEPTPVERMLDRPCVMAACGERHSLLLTETGDVWAFGENDNGVLGIGVPSTQNFSKTTSKNQPKNQEYLKQFVDAKIEAKPEHVSKLKHVVAIACGTNHSAALVKLPRKQGEMDVYSWGGGWEGKLGNDSHENVFEPTHIFMPGNAQQKQYIQISCGGSHTILLDAHGHIWFWGRRNRAGLLEMTDSKYVMTPMNLNVATDRAGVHFALISAGQSHNLALDWTGQLWGFGRNNFSQLVSDPENDDTFARSQGPEFLPLNVIAHNTKAKVLLASAGSQHSALLNMNKQCFTWGSVSSSRLGINNPVHIMAVQGKRVIPQPHVLETLPKLLNPEIFQKLAAANKQGRPPIGGGTTNLNQSRPNTAMETKSRIGDDGGGAPTLQEMQALIEQEGKGGEDVDLEQEEALFPLQQILKFDKVPLNQQKLMKTDKAKKKEFNDQLEKLFSSLRAVKDERDKAYAMAQSAIIARLYSFPVKIPIQTDIQTKIPLFVLKNKQQFEILVAAFQIHPCYSVRFLFHSNLHISDKIRLLEAVFGSYTLTNNTHKIHLLMVIAVKTLQKELEKADFIEFLQSGDLKFMKIFQLIYKHQLANKTMEDSIKRMVFTVLNSNKRSEYEKGNLKNFLHLFNDEFNLVRRQYNFEMTQELEWLLSITRNELRSKSEMLKNEEVKEQVAEGGADENAEFRERMIENFLLNLLLKNVIAQLGAMQASEILSFKKQYNMEFNVSKQHLSSFLRQLYQNLSGQSLGEQGEEELGAHSRTQLGVKDMADLKAQITELKADLVEYYVCDRVPHFELELLKDTVTHGCVPVSGHVTISCRDLCMLRNQVILQAQNMRVVPRAPYEDDFELAVKQMDEEEADNDSEEEDRGWRQQDPLIWSCFVMGDELVLPENFPDQSVFDRKLNLEVDTRLLLLKRRSNVLAICKGCGVPITDAFIGQLQDKYGQPVKNDLVQTTNLSEEGLFETYKEYETVYIRQNYPRTRDGNQLAIEQAKQDVMKRLTFPLKEVDVFEQMLLAVPIITKKAVVYDFMMQLVDPEHQKRSNINLTSVYKLMEYVQRQPEVKRKEYAEKMFHKLHKHLSTSYNLKQRHSDYQEEVEALNKMIRAQLNQVGGDQYKYVKDMDNIETNAHTGRGSLFLANFATGSEKILAGKLHRMGIQAKQKRAAIYVPDEYGDMGDDFDQKEKVNARIQLIVLMRRKIIEQIKLHGKTQLNIVKKCFMNFESDGEGGFLVTVLYKDDSKSLIQCIKPAQKREATLDQFEIKRNQLLELRKIASNKGTQDFGTEAKVLVRFDIFRLVKLINTIEGHRNH